MYVTETHDLTLNCIANANPAPSVIWFKNGEILNNDQEIQNSNLHNNAKELLKNNNSEKKKKLDYDENYSYIDNKITSNLENYNKKNEHSKERFNAINEENEKNSMKQIESSYKINKQNDSLIIRGLIEADSGYYQCIADNGVGSVRSTVKVIVMPNGKKNCFLLILNYFVFFLN